MTSNGTLRSVPSSTLSAGAIAGVSVGALIFVISALIATFFLYRKRGRKADKETGGRRIGRSLNDLRLPLEVGLMELPARERHQSEPKYQSVNHAHAWDLDLGDKKLLVSTKVSPAELSGEDHIQLEGDGDYWELDIGGLKAQ